jgi:hypothetical protein
MIAAASLAHQRGDRREAWGVKRAISKALSGAKVAHSSPPSDKPRGGSHRWDRPSLLDDVDVDIVPAIINGSSRNGVGVHGGYANESEHKSQREESRHVSQENRPIGCTK